MSTGEIWRRPDGLRWVEVQRPAVEASGWRLMVPLVELQDAPDAPPLVVTLGQWRARVHLLTGVPDSQLGEADSQLSPDQVAKLKAAVRALVE